MAKRTGHRTGCKDVGNHNRNHETHSDEITLRDEILELKRQLAVLKRANEQYTVKLRKYEDEAKRKDKQVEQLMDPRKNAEITKVLSTKGAAILMNLRDQNNTLIQMILNKDLQIRRLVAEIKMSKLYATTKKNENYRTEINRLRTLLIKSQDALKENDVQQHAKSICNSGNSFLEFSSSSDQSSPRDLDELRGTILSLESHIKQSNDLLAKKSQEISLLTNELNFLRKFFRYKTYKTKAFERDTEECKKFATTDFTNHPNKWSEGLTSTKIFTPEAFDSVDKNHKEENLPHSAPATSSKWSSSVESPPYSFSRAYIQSKQNSMEGITNSPVIRKTNRGNFEKASLLGKSLFHDLATNEILKEEKLLSNPRTTLCTKDKWMKALNKFREIKKLNQELFPELKKSNAAYKQTENISPTEFFNTESDSLEIGEKVNETKSQTLPEDVEPSLNEESNDNRSATPTSTTDIETNEKENTTLCQNSESSPPFNRKEESFFLEPISNNEKSPQNNDSLRNSKKISKTFEFNFEEGEENKITSPQKIHYRSLDSSFDSESSSLLSQEARQMKVEVQINSFSPQKVSQSQTDQSVTSVSENNQIFESTREEGGNSAPDLLDFNDDDDVIIREK